jgi:hypothetical protein
MFIATASFQMSLKIEGTQITRASEIARLFSKWNAPKGNESQTPGDGTIVIFWFSGVFSKFPWYSRLHHILGAVYTFLMQFETE